MSAFEFVFSLFGLLLGLSLAEVLNGLARTLKARRSIKVGWLTPLLGIFVMFHISSFWNDLWQMRDHLSVTSGMLYLGVILASVYYFSASLVFPEKVEEWPDLDAYYFEHKRQILAGVLSCKLVVTFGKQATTEDIPSRPGGVVAYLVAIVVVGLLFYAATLPRTKRGNVLVLLALTLPLLFHGIYTLVRGPAVV